MNAFRRWMAQGGGAGGRAMRRAEAGELAQRVLDWMIAQPDRLAAFLTDTGLDPAGLRAGLGSGALNLALIDHLMADESRLMQACADLDLPPDLPARAQAALGGGPGPNWT